MEKYICGDHHHHLNAHAVLQRRRRNPRRLRVLAAHGLLSSGDVHCAEEDSEVELAVDMPADAERRLPHHIHRRRCRILRRGCVGSQDVQAFQDFLLMSSSFSF